MPISAEKMKLYPGGSIKSAEWLEIRERIRSRANNCCEKCGVENGIVGYRKKDGDFVRITDMPNIWKGLPASKFGGPSGAKVMMIVCTTAHVDNELVDHSDENLAFWCQQCHLRHDAKQHAAASALTRQAKVGQGALF